MTKNTTTIIVSCVMVALLAGIFGFAAAPDAVPADNSKFEMQISQLKSDLVAKNTDLEATKLTLSEAQKELDSISSTVEVEEEAISDSKWIAIAWKEVLSEYDSNDTFFTCGTHEFDEDEVEYTIEDETVRTPKNGDVTVEFKVEFDFSDSSDERDCKVDRSFSVFFDENVIEDKDWNDAIISWTA